MPRTLKEEIDLSKKVSQWLTEREQTTKTYGILQRLLGSLMKAKSSHRRKEYRERLDIILMNLSIQSEDLREQKEKNKELQKKYAYIQKKHSEYVNSNLNYKS
jgi:hypothetical protein